MRIAAAVSGGMDSLQALVSLLDSGHDVVAVHGLFLPRSEEQDRTVEGLERECERLRVEFHAVDLRDAFRKLVVEPFREAYIQGLTPNPCAVCNPAVKFGIFLDRCRELGAERIATGHYFSTREVPGMGLMPRRAADPTKDQSYFLSLVPRERLLASYFPLAEQFKKDIPDSLERRGVEPPIPTESQDVCFVPGDDYQQFLETLGPMPDGGAIVLKDGTKVGEHRGLWRHTQGQRRGLGVAWSEPLYVLDKDVERNELIVGPKSELASNGCVIRNVNVFSDPASWPDVVDIRTRYRQANKAGRWEIEGDRMRLSFIEPQSRPTPGQIAALYKPDGTLLGGGIIESEF